MKSPSCSILSLSSSYHHHQQHPDHSSSGMKRSRPETLRKSPSSPALLKTTVGDWSPRNRPLDLDNDDNDKIENPVDFLKSLFSLNASTKLWMEQQQQQSRSSSNGQQRLHISKPTDAQVEAYDLEVVRAIRERNVDKLRDMLHNDGRTFDACNRFGESLIHMACRRGDMRLIQFLLDEAQVRLEVCDDFGRTPLHDACWTSQPNLDVVGLLLRKVPPSMFLTPDVRGHTPFHYARREHWPVWIGFLRENADVILRRVAIMEALHS